MSEYSELRLHDLKIVLKQDLKHHSSRSSWRLQIQIERLKFQVVNLFKEKVISRNFNELYTYMYILTKANFF